MPRPPSFRDDSARIRSWLRTMFALLGPLGLPEMLIILAIVILIFGANRLPELGRGIGAGIKNFKSGIKDDDKKD